MRVMAGTRLGPYEIVSLLGTGGMGEVYRARDCTLHRDVALKVLPDGFASDPERQWRFGREARVLASLNHANIANVHGLEESDSGRALVMELVEGPTLADLIARGPLSIGDACAIARQIAEALEAAHDVGVIHRDLKPANIKIRSDGVVKILDFGLAKALDAVSPFATATSATTGVGQRARDETTQSGIVLGTVAYIAPEQARGRAVVALADSGGPAVWVRPLDAADASVLAGTEGARGVFWSPDSRAVGYAVNRQLYRRPIEGGSPQLIASFSGQFIGAAWSGDTIVFASFPAGLMRVSANGGPPSALTRVRQGDRLHGQPVFVPDARQLLFQAEGVSRTQTCVVSLDDPALRCGDTDGALVAYLEPGRALSLRAGSLRVGPFDLRAMTATGETTPAIGEGLHLRAPGNRAAVSYSAAGVIAFRPGAAEQRQLVWFDRAGRRGEVIATGSHENFDLGPDGARILAAGTDTGGNDIVSVIDVKRGVVSRVVAGERGWANDPVWSPDGREFAYLQRGDRSRILVRPVDGGVERTVYELPDDDAWVEDWSRDGRYLAVGRSTGWRRPRAFLVPLSGGPPLSVPVEGEIVDEYHFSPDGKWLAYNSDASGRHEIYVTPLPPTGERWQVSSAGGVQPRWRKDGRELFYLAPGSTMMTVTIGEGPRFRASAPHRLFTGPDGLGSPIFDEYAVSADGRAFLIAEPVRARSVQPISVIVNWSPPDR